MLAHILIILDNRSLFTYSSSCFNFDNPVTSKAPKSRVPITHISTSLQVPWPSSLAFLIILQTQISRPPLLVSLALAQSSLCSWVPIPNSSRHSERKPRAPTARSGAEAAARSEAFRAALLSPPPPAKFLPRSRYSLLSSLSPSTLQPSPGLRVTPVSHACLIPFPAGTHTHPNCVAACGGACGPRSTAGSGPRSRGQPGLRLGAVGSGSCCPPRPRGGTHPSSGAGP